MGERVNEYEAWRAGSALAGKHTHLWFQVEVAHALAVTVGQPVAQLPQVVPGLFLRQAALARGVRRRGVMRCVWAVSDPGALGRP